MRNFDLEHFALKNQKDRKREYLLQFYLHRVHLSCLSTTRANHLDWFRLDLNISAQLNKLQGPTPLPLPIEKSQLVWAQWLCLARQGQGNILKQLSSSYLWLRAHGQHQDLKLGHHGDPAAALANGLALGHSLFMLWEQRLIRVNTS